jgi:hypothetical protein
VYSTPFEHVCENCNSLASASALIDGDTIFCLRCSKKCPYIYGHCVNAIVRIVGNTTVYCTVREPLLQNVLPKLEELSYETYLQKKANSVYMLRELQIHKKFTLNEDNAIFHIS